MLDERLTPKIFAKQTPSMFQTTIRWWSGSIPRQTSNSSVHDRFEVLRGSSERDLIEGKGGWLDIVKGGNSASQFGFSDETANGLRERGDPAL